MSKPQPVPLPQLLRMNRNAVTIYFSLRHLSGKLRRLSTTRARIAKICGLHADTITAGMKALASARWIRLQYGRFGVKTWYRISFPVFECFPAAEKTSHRKRNKRTRRSVPGHEKTGHSKAQLNRKNRPQVTVSCGRKNRPLPLKGDRGTLSPTLGAGANVPTPTRNKSEMERLQEVRREARAAIPAACEVAP